MKKSLLILGMGACLLFTSCPKAAGPSSTTGGSVKNGPAVDKVIYTVSMDETLAMKDIVEGKADVFFQAVPPNILRTLNDADKAKLDIYSVPSGSWSLLVNPIPDKAPYSWTKTDADEELDRRDPPGRRRTDVHPDDARPARHVPI